MTKSLPAKPALIKYLRIAVIGLGLLYALYTLNTSIRAMETIKTTGQVVYLPLAPVDPRAFMTGDYMTLGYNNASLPKGGEIPPEGLAVLSLDENKVGTFVRIDDKSPIAENEVKIRYAKARRGYDYGGERFYFQEGTAEIYEDADYGIFKVSPSGYALLIDLAGEDFKILKPKPRAKTQTP